MENLELVLRVIHIVSAILIVLLVLLQPSSGDGNLVSSYGGNPFVSARAKANILAKSTKYIAIIFMVNVLAISYVKKQETSSSSSIVQELIEEKNNSDVPLAE